ncbi:LysR family transcriptional regulator [Bordetella sp. H567]|uniref:LysR family transcriptional regulator n=1 Tax=Bordetella sp. H567 TaxID=1697043 RepID=UPI00081CF9D0|nr:LysR family transcriptional regulator [Bordetella sp. H567]AOB30962.1 LysR family transcriptional regulator [Bordetella sp. H567]
MKLETFRTLEAVLHSGTFAGAAKQANVTPSAVSMQMKQLELYMGKPLFDRSGLQARPNRLAHEVADTLRQALHDLEALRAGHSVAVQGVVRLGVIESLQATVLPGMIRFLRERHPRLELRLARGRSASLTAAVQAGDVDAALVAQPPKGGSARLRWTPMLRRELVLLAPPAAKENSVAALFRQYDWIRYDRQTVTGTLANQYVGTHIRQIRGTLEFDSAPAIAALISAGLGISVLQTPDAAMLQTYPMRVVKLGRAAPVLTLSLATRKVDDDNRLVDAVRHAMQAALASYQRQFAVSG